MLPPTVLLDYAWVVIGAFWVLAAFTSKRNVRGQPAPKRILHILVVIFAFFLIFSRWFAIGPLAWRLLPASPAIEYGGLAIGLAGMLFAIWGRLLLGRNWSGSVTVKEDHQLIRSGPYALVRHPIYSGLLIAVLGTVVAHGFEVRTVSGLIILAIAWHIKSLEEEAFMVDQFGSQYLAYRQQVKALVPYFW